MGADENLVDAVEADAHWTGNATHPIEFSFTLVTTDNWQWDASADFSHDSMAVRRKMVCGPADAGRFQHPEDAQDFSPGLFERQAPYYIIAFKNESLDSFVRRFLHNNLERTDKTGRTAALVDSTKTALRQSNPWLSGGIVKGKTIVLSEKTYRADGDKF